MARRIKKNDMVEVISGDHRGQRGKVLRVITSDDLVVVEGVNMVYRHVKPSRRNPQGGRVPRRWAADGNTGRRSRQSNAAKDQGLGIGSRAKACIGVLRPGAKLVL